jgi:drug/metabolite transporter (DMT)-like permease
MTNLTLWWYDAAVILLSAANAVLWFEAIKHVGTPSFTLDFLFKLGLNPFFLSAIFTALCTSVLSYWVLYSLGIGAGRLFLEVSVIATVLTSQFLLKQGLSQWQVIGFVAIMAGVLLVNY